ncbi:MAG: threonylcarbamoyl-AMP synthase [Nitrososphaerota archaeon]|nr:threonylcarbamoyl-AMP synthase [Nitrososphaerota archaeon]MDG7011029.1 threonylcarbamoyl-AMP synthase [Nitrososphaerota archaeon]
MVAVIQPIGSGSIAEAARVVRSGGLLVYPTDTVYGLGCDPFNEDAVGRLFRAKGRGSKAVPVLCGSEAKASELVSLNKVALELARAHWPGPLTIVAPLKAKVPTGLAQGTGRLGVRVPGLARCVELIDACGGWLVGTSANVSGSPSSKTAKEAFDQLGESVDLILDGGDLLGTESTVVQVEGETVTILRTGPIGVGSQVKGRRT